MHYDLQILKRMEEFLAAQLATTFDLEIKDLAN